MTLKLVCISDTHSLHGKLTLPDGDVLIHAGDVSQSGSVAEIAAFLKWFGEQPHPHKIFVAGNHDWSFQRDPDLVRRLIPEGVTYLNDSGVTIEGVKFWGSPITPQFFNWAFMRRPAEIGRHWDMIPEDTDVLITHGPPKGILDLCESGDSAGCPQLAERIELLQPKVHISGHIHEARGSVQIGKTLYANVSSCNAKYRLVHPPVVIEV